MAPPKGAGALRRCAAAPEIRLAEADGMAERVCTFATIDSGQTPPVLAICSEAAIRI